MPFVTADEVPLVEPVPVLVPFPAAEDPDPVVVLLFFVTATTTPTTTPAMITNAMGIPKKIHRRLVFDAGMQVRFDS